MDNDQGTYAVIDTDEAVVCVDDDRDVAILAAQALASAHQMHYRVARVTQFRERNVDIRSTRHNEITQARREAEQVYDTSIPSDEGDPRTDWKNVVTLFEGLHNMKRVQGLSDDEYGQLRDRNYSEMLMQGWRRDFILACERYALRRSEWRRVW